MCGIAGFVAAGRRHALERSLAAMLLAESHRGPDDEGAVIIVNGDPSELRPIVALGNRRLAIVDLSPAAHQPMESADGRVWITFNGEIYNFAELRKELAAAGYSFRSKADTEVILNGYLHWGIDRLLERLRGMFAFAIWDARAGRLLLARDRLGEKPLYYAESARGFVFASELKAIRASGMVECSLSPVAVYAYLTFGSVPAPLSIIEPVRALEPGCTLEYADGKLSTRRYWRLQCGQSNIRHDEAVERVGDLIAESVRMQMVGDVPVGLFLSGGLDSAVVLAMMRAATSAAIRAHSIVFPEEESDEAKYARITAKRFDADLTIHPVTATQMAGDLPAIIRSIDQPSIDGVNTYVVSKFTRQGGNVVALCGIGGDELFGGYPTFRRIPTLMKIGSATQALGPAGWIIDKLLACGVPSTRAGRLRDFFANSPSVVSAYLAVRGILRDREIAAILNRDFFVAGRNEFNPLDYLHGLCGGAAIAPANTVSILELRAYMHNQLLRDTDAMSMAHGLEVRCPLIDHQLVEFVLALKPEVKFARRPKNLMVQAFKNVLPEEIVSRSKSGFIFPFDKWFRTAWRDQLYGFLNQRSGDDVFDRDGVARLWGAFEARRVHWSRVWAIAVLNEWLSEFRRSHQVRKPSARNVVPLVPIAD